MPRKTTRNAQGGGSIRQRKDGKWEARYTVGRDPGTGKQIRKSIYGDTQQEVRKKLQQATTAVDDGLYTEPSKLTVGTWLDIWVTEYLGSVKPRTIDSYKAICRVHLKPAFGNIKLTALSAHTIQAFYNKLQRDNSLSPKSIHNIHGVLHKGMQQAVELGPAYIKYNPADACKLPRVEKKEIKPLDNGAINAFLEAIAGHRYEIFFSTTLFTGVRQGEALGLAWSNIDFDKNIITVKQQLVKNRITKKFELAPPKNDKTRFVTPASSVMAALREQKRLQAEWKLKAGPAWEDLSLVFTWGNTDLVFTNEIGQHLSPSTAYKNYKSIVANIGESASRFHDLRHSYATASLAAGVNVKDVQEALGHHTAAFTLDRYGHVTEQMKKESAAKMEAFIQSVKPNKKTQK